MIETPTPSRRNFSAAWRRLGDAADAVSAMTHSTGCPSGYRRLARMQRRRSPGPCPSSGPRATRGRRCGGRRSRGGCRSSASRRRTAIGRRRYRSFGDGHDVSSTLDGRTASPPARSPCGLVGRHHADREQQVGVDAPLARRDREGEIRPAGDVVELEACERARGRGPAGARGIPRRSAARRPSSGVITCAASIGIASTSDVEHVRDPHQAGCQVEVHATCRLRMSASGAGSSRRR